MNRFYRPLGGYRPNPWTGFRWGGGHTTFVQNNFYGGGPRPMGFGGVFRFGGFRGGCCHGGCGGGNWMNWMLGIGMGTTFLGGILNMFGLGGGSTAGTTVIDDRANQNSNTRSTTRTSSETNISITNIYQQLEEMNKKLDAMQEELNGGDSDSDSDIDSDDEIDTNNETGNNNTVNGGGDNDSDSDADSDDEISVGGGGRVNGNNGNNGNIPNLTPGATPVTVTSTVHTNDCPVTPGETTWFEVARGMYTGANGAALTKDDIKAIYTALRAQYVDGGHVVNGQVYDKNNKLVDVSNMDLPKGVVKLPDTITVDGKTYNYNKDGKVTPSSYSTNNSNITRAGAFSAVKTSDNKWEPTINGHTYGGGHYDSKDEAIGAAKDTIEEIKQENTPITE